MRFGAHTRSSFLHGVRNRASGTFALLAILLHVVIPTAYDLASPATLGLMQATICAGGEARQILIDRDGKPVQPTPAQNHDCKACVSHCAALFVAAITSDAPHWTLIFSAPLVPVLALSLLYAGVHPRGPPA